MTVLQMFFDWLVHYFTCKEWEFQFLKHMLNILIQDDSIGTTRFMLRFKMAAEWIHFYVKNINVLQGARSFTLANIIKILFLGDSFGAIRFMLRFKMGLKFLKFIRFS